MNPKEIFEGKAEIYAQARPSYPAAFFDYLLARLSLAPRDKVADMGAGTGIFSRLLLERGLRVTALEPNDDMRKQANVSLKGFPYFTSLAGTAEHSGLPDGSQDLVTAAQAFHWFDAEGFRKECRRILKREGSVVLVWNNREASSALVRSNAEICRCYCPSFKGFSGGMGEETTSQEESLGLLFGTNGYEVRSFKNELIFNREGFIRRNLSSSYAPFEGSAVYKEFVHDLGELFDHNQTDGTLLMPNITRSYLGRV